MLSLSKIFRRHISISRILAGRVTQVPLPALSPTMETGSLVSWDKSEGDRLSEGDLLAEIETDKATMGFETPEEGYLAKILIPAGTKGVKLGEPLCIIVDDESDLEKYKNFSIEEAIKHSGLGSAAGPGPGAETPSTPKETPSSEPSQIPSRPSFQAAPPQSPSQAPIQSNSQPQAINSAAATGAPRTFASPLARRLAREGGFALPSQGSGPNGRVVASDLSGQAASEGTVSRSTVGHGVSSPPPSAEFTDIPLTNMRQTIAKRLTQSKQDIPHYYLTVNLNVDELLELRQKSNSLLSKEGIKLSVNDFIVKAAALACKKIPQVNSSWNGTYIRQFNRVDVCVAVSTDTGLITPIVFEAENKGIQDISSEIKHLAEKARSNKLQPHEFQGGTFTISNLGMFDIDHFTAVINPPQAAILAVGTTQKTLVPANEDGDLSNLKAVSTLRVTLSCDHRVVDGAVGAQWLRVFRRYIEKPYTMLL